jgi:glyceraldehyde-3-phosphate dehydrogenase/erythrose-4-phosphate dehydrogenase
MLNIAINSLRRIGRATLKTVLNNLAPHLFPVNGLLTPNKVAYLLKVDTVYGRWDGPSMRATLKHCRQALHGTKNRHQERNDENYSCLHLE